MPAVAFVFADWIGQYPEFAARVTEPQTTGFFNRAGLTLLPNSDAGPVPDPVRRGVILYLIVAHLAQLHAPTIPGGQPSGLVGRISSAGEGSVSVSVDMGPVTAQSAWWLQTSYGAEAWQALAPTRLGRYVPPPMSRLGFDVMRRF